MESTLTTSSLIESKFVENKIEQQTLCSSLDESNRANTESTSFYPTMQTRNKLPIQDVENDLKSSNHEDKSVKAELNSSLKLEKNGEEIEGHGEPIVIPFTSTNANQLNYIELSATSITDKLNENNQIDVYQINEPTTPEIKSSDKKTNKKVRTLLSNRCSTESSDTHKKIASGNKKGETFPKTLFLFYSLAIQSTIFFLLSIKA
jgi:hypothetical protein